MLEKVLRKYGNIEKFSNIEDCIKQIELKAKSAQLYDLAIIDFDMPDFSAVRILRKLREVEEELNQKPKNMLLLSKDKNIKALLNFFTIKEDRFLLKTNNEVDFIKYLKEINL